MKSKEDEAAYLIALAKDHARFDSVGLIPGCVKRLAIAIAKEKQTQSVYHADKFSLNWKVYWNEVIEIIENE